MDDIVWEVVVVVVSCCCKVIRAGGCADVNASLVWFGSIDFDFRLFELISSQDKRMIDIMGGGMCVSCIV